MYLPRNKRLCYINVCTVQLAVSPSGGKFSDAQPWPTSSAVGNFVRGASVRGTDVVQPLSGLYQTCLCFSPGIIEI